MATTVLDNEAVQALMDPAHRKHRRALAFVQVAAARNLRRAGTVALVVPTAVRVEAEWDRTAPRASAINRLRIVDHLLDRVVANGAARLRAALGVSVADAHLGAAVASTVGHVSVLTSDVDDVTRVAGHLRRSVTVVRL